MMVDGGEEGQLRGPIDVLAPYTPMPSSFACRAIGSVSGSSRRSRPWTPSDADFVQPDRARRS